MKQIPKTLPSKLQSRNDHELVRKERANVETDIPEVLKGMQASKMEHVPENIPFNLAASSKDHCNIKRNVKLDPLRDSRARHGLDLNQSSVPLPNIGDQIKKRHSPEITYGRKTIDKKSGNTIWKAPGLLSNTISMTPKSKRKVYIGNGVWARKR